MEDDRHLVGRQVDVELQGLGALRDGELERRYRVLRRIGRSAAVRDDELRLGIEQRIRGQNVYCTFASTSRPSSGAPTNSLWLSSSTFSASSEKVISRAKGSW